MSDDQAWLACFGVLPETEASSGDEWVREVRIPVTHAEEVHITWDLTDNSVRLRHHRDGSIVCDLFREMATRLTVIALGSAGEVAIDYGSSGWSGHARVRVLPHVLMKDAVLRT